MCCVRLRDPKCDTAATGETTIVRQKNLREFLSICSLSRPVAIGAVVQDLVGATRAKAADLKTILIRHGKASKALGKAAEHGSLRATVKDCSRIVAISD